MLLGWARRQAAYWDMLYGVSIGYSILQSRAGKEVENYQVCLLIEKPSSSGIGILPDEKTTILREFCNKIAIHQYTKSAVKYNCTIVN